MQRPRGRLLAGGYVGMAVKLVQVQMLGAICSCRRRGLGIGMGIGRICTRIKVES